MLDQKEIAMSSSSSVNPAVFDWSGPNGLPRFDAVSDGDYAPAFDAALAAHDAEIDAIANNPEPPTFEIGRAHV